MNKIFEPLIKTRFSGDKEKARTKVGLAKKSVQLIMNAAKFQNLKQDVFMRTYDQGDTQIKATLSFDCILLDIWCRPTAKKRERKDVEIITRPIVLVAVGYYSYPGSANPTVINAYHDYYTYPRRVMLYDVIDDCVIETMIDGVAKQSITTTQLKDICGINVWHFDRFGNLTDIGFRLSDDWSHEKSFPLSRYLFNTEGFLDYTYIYAHGAHRYCAVTWGAEDVLPPLPPGYPGAPSSCTGGCIWNTPRYENSNRNEKVVDTKGTEVEAINSHTKYIYHEQYDFVFQRCELGYVPICPLGTTGIIAPLPGGARADWRCKFGSPADRRIFENYGRFGGSYRLTTRDEYPSLETGCVGYIQTKNDDYQDQASHVWGFVMWGGFQGQLPNPTYIYSYERKINIIVECSFGELYRTKFSHGTYDYWTCSWAGTEGTNGDDFEFPGVQQAFVGIEAGIIDNKVVSVTTVVAGTERRAWPYIGDYANPCKWDNRAQYNQPKAQGVKAGINITELDKELDYVDMIMSANDIDYFSLRTGGNFETALNALVEEYYKEDCHDEKDEFVDPMICLESRVIEQYVEKNIETGAERIIGYGSCKQPNPWITPKAGKSFWRPL